MAYFRPTAARFATIDADNPHLWELFERFTFEMIRRGFQHYSARAVLHRIRWETASVLDDDSSYKVSNAWSPFYARKFHRVYPQHDKFFRTRPAIADADGRLTNVFEP